MMLTRSEPRSQTKRKTCTLYPIQELKHKVDVWAVKLRVNPKLVRVQEMRYKWGSCSSAGTITLARDLCDKEEIFQDYVVVHELLHLRYPVHGMMFKVLMTMHVPGWRELEEMR
jgi:predicted metal-dependent hydrolase